MICSNCCRELDDDFDFCPFCGEKVCKKKICPKCGFESNEVNCCPECGVKLLTEAKIVKEAEKLMKNYRYKEANQYYSKAISLNPNNINYYINKSLCLEKSGDYRGSVEQLKISLSRFRPTIINPLWGTCRPKYREQDYSYLKPEKLMYYLFKAKCLEELGFYEEAGETYKEIKLFGQVLKCYDNSKELNYVSKNNKDNLSDSEPEMKVIYDGSKNQICIKNNIEKIIFYGDIVCAWRLYYILLLEGNKIEFTKYDSYGNSKKRLDKYLALIREDSNYHEYPECGTPLANAMIRSREYYKKALFLKRQKKYCDALDVYNEAIMIYSYDKRYYEGKAECLKKLGRYEEAIICYDKAIELDPNNPKYYENKAFCLRQNQKVVNKFKESIKKS